MKNVFLLMCFFGLLLACKPKETVGVAEQNFFDLSDFVQQKIDEGAVYESVNRVVTIGDEKEERNLGQYDMTDALSFLNQFNINRPRWSDKYQEKQEGNATVYTALDDDMKIRMMKVVGIDENDISEIVIDYISETLISTADKHIIYKPTSSLKIETFTDPLFGENKETIVQWDF